VNRRTLTRAITFTTGVALGLNLLTGAAFAAPATPDVPANTATGVVTADPSPHTSGPSDQVLECSPMHHSDTDHGANNDDGYQNTCDEADFGGNGQESGPGLQTGKPCAGCVGNADDKNPPGQYPDGSDHNSGYECDGRDRPADNQQGNGNHGIGDENPAHTGCDSAPVVVDEPEHCADGSVMPETGTCPVPEDEHPNPPTCPGENTLPPAADTDGNGMIDLEDCKPVTPPVFTCEDSEMSATDVNHDGTIDEQDCVAPEETPAFTCDDSEMPATDVNHDGTVDASDCIPETPETPVLPENVTCPDGSALPMTDQDGNGIITPADCVHTTPPVEEETPVTPIVDETPAAPEAEVVPTIVETPEVEVPVSVLAVELEQPAAVATQITPAPQVLSLTAATPVRETAVLGVEIERGAAPLARTGAGDVAGQLVVALSLLALGFGLVRLGRRPAGTVG
jgi:hypothetical protein